MTDIGDSRGGHATRRASRARRLCPPYASMRELDSNVRTAQSHRMIAITSRPPADHPVLPALLSRPTPAVMGVLNITPDSFSDGGQFMTPGSALTQATRMIAEGADIV